MKRYLSGFLLTTGLLISVAGVKADDDHHRYRRYYDREGRDYHVYNQQEDRAYRGYLREQLEAVLDAHHLLRHGRWQGPRPAGPQNPHRQTGEPTRPSPCHPKAPAARCCRMWTEGQVGNLRGEVHVGEYRVVETKE